MSLAGGVEKLNRDARSAPRARPDFVVPGDFGHLVGLTKQKDVSVAESAARRKERAHRSVTVGGTDNTLCLRAISDREAIEPRLTTHSTPAIPRAGPAAEIRGYFTGDVRKGGCTASRCYEGGVICSRASAD